MAKHSSIEFISTDQLSYITFENFINELQASGWTFVNESEAMYMINIDEANWYYSQKNIADILNELSLSVKSGNTVGIVAFNKNLNFDTTILFKIKNNSIDFEIHSDKLLILNTNIADFTKIIELLLPIINKLSIEIEAINCNYN